MIRLLLWRLGFEFWDLMAVIISLDSRGIFDFWNPPIIYFAFGANLDPSVLYRRRMRVSDRQEFLVRDYEMRFTQQGPFKGGGFASLEETPGKVAYGHLLELRRVDAIRMDFSELVPIFKRHRRVTITQDGATFFFYQATEPVEGLIPTEEYREKILQAAETSTIIPPELLSELRQIPALDVEEPSTDIRLFVDDISAWPEFLRGFIHSYEGWCFALFRRTIRLSLCGSLIRMDQQAKQYAYQRQPNSFRN